MWTKPNNVIFSHSLLHPFTQHHVKNTIYVKTRREAPRLLSRKRKTGQGPWCKSNEPLWGIGPWLPVLLAAPNCVILWFSADTGTKKQHGRRSRMSCLLNCGIYLTSYQIKRLKMETTCAQPHSFWRHFQFWEVWSNPTLCNCWIFHAGKV